MWLDLVFFKEKNILYLIKIENITWVGSSSSPKDYTKHFSFYFILNI